MKFKIAPWLICTFKVRMVAGGPTPINTVSRKAMTTGTMCSVARICAIVIFALLVWGCAPDEVGPGKADHGMSSEDIEGFRAACAGIPGCGESRVTAPGPSESIWRVLVVRTPEGKPQIARVDRIDVPKGEGVPLGPLSGSHRLIGLDAGGEPVDGQLVRFPEVLRLEFASGEAPEEIDLTDRRVSAVGYLRESEAIETLMIQDESGATVASEKAPSRTAWRLSSPIAAAYASGPETGAEMPELPPYCSHVMLIYGEEERELAEGLPFEESVRLVAPGPTQRALIYAALGLTTPLLCQGIGRIALGALPPSSKRTGAVQQAGAGDMILLNTGAGYGEDDLIRNQTFNRLRMAKSLLHEAAHTAEALLNSESSLRERGFSGNWEPEPRALAGQTVQNVRLRKGLRMEWLRVHASFQDVGWAHGHQSGQGDLDAVKLWSANQTAEAGFMSWYGATSLEEDIAEIVAWPYMTDLFFGVEGEERQDLACQEMRRYRDKNIPSRLAAVYTKLMFVRDLGLVMPEDAERCTGRDIGLPPMSAQGFEIWQGNMQLTSFSGDVSAGLGTLPTGNRVLQMSATGEAEFGAKRYPATLRLQLDLQGSGEPLDNVSWPRGVYRLGRAGGNSSLGLALEGNMAGSFDALEGYALVVEASTRQIAGSIFLTKVMEYSAPPTPEVYDPPLIIRFLVE